MYEWETRLTTRDENRVVRPLEWGFDWLEPFLREHGFESAIPAGEIARDNAAAEAAMLRINKLLIQHSDRFFGYERPTDFRLEERHPMLFPTNVRPETLAMDAEIRQMAQEGKTEKATFLRFTSPERTPYPENDLVNARWYPAPAHKDPRRPKQAIVVLPQWNADAFSHNALCAIFNKFGVSALRLSKPYHDIRRPSELERSDYAVSANIGRTISACRQAVVDIRCCIDWLEEQGYEHFGVLGTSLGSCYAFLASAHDKRIRVNAFNHASTAFGDVVWAGQSTRHIREGLEEAGLTQERLRTLWSAISPISHYDRVASVEAGGPGKKVLVVYADYDLTFPKEYSLQVVEAFKRIGLNFTPKVLPCGHYTTGETPYKYLDGWYLGSFVHRAFKELRAEVVAAQQQELAVDRSQSTVSGS
jgi:dienelactone hydrolase